MCQAAAKRMGYSRAREAQSLEVITSTVNRIVPEKSLTVMNDTYINMSLHLRLSPKILHHVKYYFRQPPIDSPHIYRHAVIMSQVLANRVSKGACRFHNWQRILDELSLEILHTALSAGCARNSHRP
jgi:hypothetical protein